MIINVDSEIKLKTVELDDVENRYGIMMKNKEYLKKWLGWLDYYKNVNDLIEYTKICQKKESNKEAYIFGIYYKDEYVGCIEIQNIDYRNKKCEIGYWLSEDANGNGIMIRTCKTVVGYIFEIIKLNKINILALCFAIKYSIEISNLGEMILLAYV